MTPALLAHWLVYFYLHVPAFRRGIDAMERARVRLVV